MENVPIYSEFCIFRLLLFFFSFVFFLWLLSISCFFIFLLFLFLSLTILCLTFVAILIQLFQEFFKFFFFLLLFRFFILFRLILWLFNNFLGDGLRLLLRRICLIFILIFAWIICNTKRIPNGVKLKLFGFKLLSLETSLDGFNMCKISSEFFLRVERNDVVFPLLGLFFWFFRGSLGGRLLLGGRSLGLLFLWWFRVRLILIAGDVIPSIHGWIRVKNTFTGSFVLFLLDRFLGHGLLNILINKLN